MFINFALQEPYECLRFITSPIGGLKARVDHPDKVFDKVNFYFPNELKSSGATLEDCTVRKYGIIITTITTTLIVLCDWFVAETGGQNGRNNCR